MYETQGMEEVDMYSRIRTERQLQSECEPSMRAAAARAHRRGAGARYFG